MTNVSWKYADVIKRLLDYQYFKEDFQTQRRFSNVISISPGLLSKHRGASSFRREHKDNKYIQLFSIDKNYLLFSLKYGLDDFVDKYGGYEVISNTADSILEKDIRKHKKEHFIY